LQTSLVVFPENMRRPIYGKIVAKACLPNENLE